MSLEIERKFLVNGPFKQLVRSSVRISQGYLCCDEERTVRVRLWGDEGRLTIKGRSTDNGLTRFEWEIPIDKNDALELLQLCLPGRIDKTRYLVDWGNLTFEVDEFYGDNEGLLIAEVELPSADTPVDLPPFIGREVTGDEHYYNSYLARHPYLQHSPR